MTDDSADMPMPAPTPAQLLVLLVPALVVGVLCALVLRALDLAAGALQGVLWTTLPGALGVDPNGWWIVVVLTATGFAVGLGLQFLPGHGGPDSATTELVAEPLKLRTLPGLVIVTGLALAGGVSLGPENPIIAINVALTVALFGRLMPRVGANLGMLMAAAGTIGALFGSPVAAALLFTGTLAAIRGGGALWDKLFLPLASAGAAAGTMHVLGAPPLQFTLPTAPTTPLLLLAGIVIAVAGVAIGLIGAFAFPFVHRAFHSLRQPLLIATAGGLVLGLLGLIGGPITLFKGLDQMGELFEDPDAYDPGQLVVIVLIKLVALVVAASAAFRGGRIFPAAFAGAALGLLAHALIPSLPIALCVASALIGILLVMAKDGWLALFVAAAVAGDLALLPWLCVIILPAWLLVSRAPEFRIVSGSGPEASPATADAGRASEPDAEPPPAP
ncbi:ion channel protein [Agromyces marinus]|uniref:ion channel protein n=1 Tax=Agromyces marinus TaxID=1389020 RepID=UPI001F478D9F|nr:ion channel protein [Agromyces marinus]UIP59956.1 Putative ion-transport protein YfeO [Agromyces marinus]